MRIAGDGPKPHFMTEVGVLFRNEAFQFSVVTMDEAFREALEAKLKRAGGRLLEFRHWAVTLELCPGTLVTVTQMHTSKADRNLWHGDGRPFYYLDVEVSVPACHDAYGGVLGQTYRCKHIRDGEAFTWSDDREEMFRLPGGALLGASGALNVEAACFGDVDDRDGSIGDGEQGVSGRTTENKRRK